MTKAKKTKARTVASLTTAELDKLAKRLLLTRGNVYVEMGSLFGVDDPDKEKIFERLEKEARTFKCERCDLWKPSGEMDRDIPDACRECVEADDE